VILQLPGLAARRTLLRGEALSLALEGTAMRLVRGVALAVFLVPSLLFAQAQGRIKGTVKDAKGNPIPNAKVIITCPDIANFHKELVADRKGEWATLVVDATRHYLFHVEAAGFQPVEQLLKPRIGGETLEAPFTLQSVADLQAMQQQKVLEEPGIKQVREAQELGDAADEAEAAAKAARDSGDKVLAKEKSEEAAKKLAEAWAKFAEAVAAKPELHLAWLNMGNIDFKMGKNDDALMEAEKCLALKPDLPQCLGLALNAAQGKKDKALIAKYSAAYAAANPTDPTVFYNQAVEYLNKADDAKARPLLEKALEANPKHADSLFQLGMVLFRSGDTAKAKELLQKFLEVAPNHPEAPTAKEMLKYM
jgi:tetratricopeptide (TPR) repeat protein